MQNYLLLHGALGSYAQLQSLKMELERHGHHVFGYNFSGHGGQPFRTDFGIEQFALETESFLQTNNLERVTIFGYSMGGYVALWLAHTKPHLVNSVITLGTKFDWSEAAAAKEVAKMNPEKIELKIPAFARVLQHRHHPTDWKELMRKTTTMMTALGSKPLLTESIVKTIATPVVVGVGDADDMVDRAYAEKIATILTRGNFQLLENTPHLFEQVELERVLALIKP